MEKEVNKRLQCGRAFGLAFFFAFCVIARAEGTGGQPVNAGCFIDGELTPRCPRVPADRHSDYVGVSWPVYTAGTPEEVWSESWRKAARSEVAIGVPSPFWGEPAKPPRVLTVPIAEYPDVMCLKFERTGGQVCFDTMEITER